MKSATRSIAQLAILMIALVSFCKAATVVAPVSPVSLRDAMSDALSLAAQHTNAKVMKISGNSMFPFFGEGSLIVVKQIDESKLRPGMVVVYTNRFGETVAHRLVNRTSDAWTAKGYNNSEADSTPVNAGNLIGVVYATFLSMGTEASLASNTASLETALAAPAK